MKINLRQQILGLATVATLALGGLGTMAFTNHTQPVAQAQPVGEDGDTIQDPSYTGSVPVDQIQTEGMSEADEAAALQGSAKIDAAAAEAAAITANPGATVVKSELDNENGSLVYSVELNNGMDVKVDAGNGTILHTDQDNDANEAGESDEASEGSEAGDTDNVQDEQTGQPDDATEMPGVEDAAGQ